MTRSDEVGALRVLMLSDAFQRYALLLSHALVDRGHHVMMVCRDQAYDWHEDRELRDEEFARARERGIDVLHVAYRYRNVLAVPHVAAVHRAVRRWRPDVIHAQQWPDPRTLGLAARRPFLMTVHDPTRHPGDDGTPRAVWAMHSAAERLWLRRARALIVHGAELEHELRSLGVTPPIAVIPHGVRTSESPAPLPPQPTIGFFGRLLEYKGLPVLMAAMRCLWETRPDVRLLVVGEGDAASLDADPRIELRNHFIPDTSIVPTLTEMTVLVLPYIQASQSGPGSQAIGLGVPVVVSDVGALPQLTLDPSYVVEPRRPDLLAEALLRHLDHSIETRWEVLRRLGEPHSWHTVAGMHAELYQRCMRAPV